MGNLLLGHRKSLGCTRVQQLPTEFLAHRQEAGVAQHTVDVHWAAHLGDPILGKHDDVRAILLHMLYEFAAEGIDSVYIVPDRRMVGTEALQVVIEMRQIDQGEDWLVLVVDISRTVFDPLTRDNVCPRSPESK